MDFVKAKVSEFIEGHKEEGSEEEKAIYVCLGYITKANLNDYVV